MDRSARLRVPSPRSDGPAQAAAIRLLIVEDDRTGRLAMREYFSMSGFEVTEADSCESALRTARAAVPDLVLLDFALPDGDALTLLPRLRKIAPDSGVVLLTGHGSVDLAVRAIKSGADHFLCKPVQLAELEATLRGLTQQRHLERTHRADRVRRDRHPLDPFAGSSPAIRALAHEAARVAESNAPVLLTGPTGSGKGVLASWLHARGPRADEPFVDINCASLSREFLESELFGHCRGAFTGAVSDKPGLIEVAHRGTLFLDEIGDMPADIQPRLLKVIEERRYRRMGSVEECGADVRLIAATHHDLWALVRHGRFRDDLYFRIQTLPLCMPALSERIEDLPLLAESMLRDLALESGRPQVRLPAEMLAALRRYDWPGNLRELRNVLERALLLSRDGELDPQSMRFDPRLEPSLPFPVPTSNGPSLRLEEVERRHILATFEAQGGNVLETAAALGMPRSSLYQKLQRFGIHLRARASQPPA